MAQLVITIPDPQLNRVVVAVSSTWGYSATIWVDGVQVPNPETRVNYIRRYLRDHITGIVRAYEAREAKLASENTFQDPGITSS